MKINYLFFEKYHNSSNSFEVKSQNAVCKMELALYSTNLTAIRSHDIIIQFHWLPEI